MDSYCEGKTKLTEGILSTGVDVIDLGLVTTPMLYYARMLKKINAGIMVTASHNPKDDNGFKFSFSEIGNAKGEEIFKFRDFVINNAFDEFRNIQNLFSVSAGENLPYIKCVRNSPADSENGWGFRSIFRESGYSAGQNKEERTGDHDQEIRILPSSLCITCFFFSSEISA